MTLSEKDERELTENIKFIRQHKDLLQYDSIEDELTHKIIDRWLTNIIEDCEIIERLCNNYDLLRDEYDDILESEYQKISEIFQFNNLFDYEDGESESYMVPIEEFYKRLKHIEEVLASLGCYNIKVYQTGYNFDICFSRIETNEEFAIRIKEMACDVQTEIKRQKAKEKRAQKNKDSKSIEKKRKEYEKLKALFEKEEK